MRGEERKKIGLFPGYCCKTIWNSLYFLQELYCYRLKREMVIRKYKLDAGHGMINMEKIHGC